MSFKAGDKVKRISGGDSVRVKMYVGNTYNVISTEEDEERCWLALEGLAGTCGNPHQWDAGCFELIKEEKNMNTFSKKDLKTGNRITFKHGRYIVFLNTPQNYREDAADFIVAANANGSCSWQYLSKVDFDDITKVEIPNHPYVLVRISTSSEEYTTIWEKPVPLTPEQIKQQEFQAKYDAAKKELEELGLALGVTK